MVKTPKRGTPLYRDNGVDDVETFVFLEENIAPGASVPTWVIRKRWSGDTAFRVSKGNSFRLTRKEALQDLLLSLRCGVKTGRKLIAEQRLQIKDAQHRIKEVKLKLDSERMKANQETN